MRRALLLLLLGVFVGAACATPVDLNWPDAADDDDDVASQTPTPTPTPPQSLTIDAPVVLNTCWSLISTGPAANTIHLELNGPQQPVAGGRLLLVQVAQGAPTAATPTADSVGLWQRVDVGPVSADTAIHVQVTTLGPTLAMFRSDNIVLGAVAARAQACTLPRFQDVVITTSGEVRASTTWDDTLGFGGVVAMEVVGTLTVNGAIRANAAGFTGGISTPRVSVCINEDGPSGATGGFGGRRGDGWVGSLANTAQAFGRSPNGTGGGGGNCQGAGGGGGGHAGSGGIGGYAKDETVGDIGQGEPGAAHYGPTRLLFGGGGGAGQGMNPGGGGRGGGIVFLSVANVAHTPGPFSDISASGSNGGGGNTESGAGGGGAGGTVYLEWFGGVAGMYPNLGLGVVAVGGNGGNSSAPSCTSAAGTGGGGGGGYIHVPVAAVGSLGQGIAGLCLSGFNMGAQPGVPGTRTNF